MHAGVPVFELSGERSGLSMWRLTEPGESPPTARGDLAHFRVDVAGEAVDVDDRLDRLQAGLLTAEAALPTAAERLDRLVAAAGPGLSFDTTEAPLDPSSPEAELLRSVDIRSDGTDEAGSGLASLQAWWTPTATIETVNAAGVVAATVLTLQGRVSTACATDAAPTQLARHARAVELVTASRIHVLRSLSVAAAGAVAVAARVWLPGGPVLALPAVWRFVRRVLDPPSQPGPSRETRR